jgi:hypothetical protein
LTLGHTFTAALPEKRMTAQTPIDLDTDEMEFLDKQKLALVSSSDSAAR